MSPTLGVESLTTLKTARSVCNGVRVSVSVLLSGLGSVVVEVTVAVLSSGAMGPEAGVSTVACTVNGLSPKGKLLPNDQVTSRVAGL